MSISLYTFCEACMIRRLASTMTLYCIASTEITVMHTAFFVGNPRTKMRYFFLCLALAVLVKSALSEVVLQIV